MEQFFCSVSRNYVKVGGQKRSKERFRTGQAEISPAIPDINNPVGKKMPTGLKAFIACILEE